MAVASWVQHRAFYERPAERGTIHKIWRISSNTAGVLGTLSSGAPYLKRIDLDLGCPHSYDVLAGQEFIRNFGALRSMISELQHHPFIVDSDRHLGGWLEAPREYRNGGPFVFGLDNKSIVGEPASERIVVFGTVYRIELATGGAGSEDLHTIWRGTTVPRITDDGYWALVPHTKSDGLRERMTILSLTDHNVSIITNARALHAVATLMGAT